MSSEFFSFLQPTDPPEVKYNVAFITAAASIIVAILGTAFSIVSLRLSRRNQSALQTEQAALTQRNQRSLATLQSNLERETQTQLENAKSVLAEQSQKRLEAFKAEMSVKNQADLEQLKSSLAEQGQDRNARRDYEYEARKRLYAECEPLLFQLAEMAEHGYHRIYSLARTARLGGLPRWLRGNGYYMRSTLYKLIVPLVIFRLIQQRVTFIDLTLDEHIARQYRLLKFLYLTFTDSFEFAKLSPGIDYQPDVRDWEEMRQSDEAKHWRQGLYLGSLDNVIDVLIVENEAGKSRWKTYGQFEREFAQKDSDTYKYFSNLADVFQGFHPKKRPILWRMLWTQTLIYEQIIEAQSLLIGGTRVNLAAVSPQLPGQSLEWRTSPDEASDFEVLTEPHRVAREYLEIRLPDIFLPTDKNKAADDILR